MISNEISQIKDGYGKLEYCKHEGGFFVAFESGGIINSFYSCRDQFFGVFEEKTSIIGFYLFPGLNINQLNGFFEQIENKLNLEEKIIFHPSSIDNLVVIEVPNFWREHMVKRSLFTLFLRCGSVYYKGNVNNAIESYSLANSVKHAIEHFLDGNIFPTFNKWKNNIGFVNEFYGMPTKELFSKFQAFQVKPAQHFTT